MADIRRLIQPDDLRDAATFQDHPAFGAQPIRFSQPALVALAHNGGLVLGAYDNGDLIGLSVSFLGTDVSDPKRPAMANLKMVTTFLGVHPDARAGVGFELLLEQRAYATRQGIRLITWTLDPLNAAYADLSLHQLGAITGEFVADYFGANGHPTSAADRLVIEWWVTNRRVEERLTGRRVQLELDAYLGGNATVINPSQPGEPWPQPEPLHAMGEATILLLEIPIEFGALHVDVPELAASWREHVRVALRAVLSEGYIITDFVQGNWQGRPRSFYVLSLAPRSFFSLS
ncbi:hypothetical protein [Aggregatilinea lenta]|uniref:hypothetical protein n=1 Tax=Aggregatilinea lenta TaxID=913108 RepID=UPI0013C3513D|nr:hypothetical protein [Aggregatilinea lenta]